jgi:hypothetical protein
MVLCAAAQIFRFYYRCKNCAAEFCMKTDPKTSDYVMEQGASRNYEPWREVRWGQTGGTRAPAADQQDLAYSSSSSCSSNPPKHLPLCCSAQQLPSCSVP